MTLVALSRGFSFQEVAEKSEQKRAAGLFLLGSPLKAGQIHVTPSLIHTVTVMRILLILTVNRLSVNSKQIFNVIQDAELKTELSQSQSDNVRNGKNRCE